MGTSIRRGMGKPLEVKPLLIVDVGNRGKVPMHEVEEWIEDSLFDDTVDLGQGNTGSDCGLGSSEGFRLKPRRGGLPALSRRRHDIRSPRGSRYDYPLGHYSGQL